MIMMIIGGGGRGWLLACLLGAGDGGLEAPNCALLLRAATLKAKLKVSKCLVPKSTCIKEFMDV